MKINAFKYLLAYSLPYAVLMSFMREAWMSFLPLVLSFVFIPALEFLIKPQGGNLSEAEAALRRKDFAYDLIIWLMLPLQYFLLIWYFFSISDVSFMGITWWGRSLSMGLLCGVTGINIAHELGHRKSKVEQFMSKALLMTSLYPHFFIEHNYGHHRNVATPEDPASARFGENLYSFWIRSAFFSYLEAWKIESRRVKRKGRRLFSLHNEMLRFSLLELLLLLGVFIIFGWQVLLGFLVAAVFGVLLLETVNYIEHYGLHRERIKGNRYEDTSPAHSWNSDHLLGRLFLFELSRHSDHHAYPHKKYQMLGGIDEAPQMPTGYPGMMILACFPPLWFKIMNSRIRKLQGGGPEAGVSVTD